MELALGDGVQFIERDSYESARDGIRHLFLVGDLKRDPPHPFLRDGRVEVILCTYGPGDDGEFHWHPKVTEYEYVIRGEIGTLDVLAGVTRWSGQGDLIIVPQGACVRRLVRMPVQTLAVKVPSDSGKIECGRCQRQCTFRVAPQGSE